MTQTTEISAGMNAQTGEWLTGWDHVVQSVERILLTRVGQRVMREWFGSYVPAALGRPLNEEVLLPLMAAISAALELWEPRVRLVSVDVGSTPREGRVELTLILAYRPRALLGDTSEEQSPMRIVVALANRAIIITGETA